MEAEASHPFWAVVYSDDDVFVSVNTDPSVGELSLCFAEIGMGPTVSLADWTTWLCTLGGATLRPLEQQLLLQTRERLEIHLPDLDSILSRIDQGRQSAKSESLEQEREQLESAHRSDIESNHIASKKVALRLQESGLLCPHCKETTSNMKYYKGYPDAKSYFVCGLCSRSYTPS